MAVEDKDSRTEKPTQRRVEKAHRKGQFAKAEEINTVFLLAAFTVAILFLMVPKGQDMLRFGEYILEHLDYSPVTMETASYWLREGVGQMMLFLMPFFVVAMLAAVLAGGLQSGFKLTPEVLKFNLDKLNPVSGLKRIFSLKSVMTGAMDILKIVAVVAIIWGLIEDIKNDPIFYEPTPLQHIPEFFYDNAVAMLFRVILTMTFIAGVHYAYQRWQTEEDLKMTKQEVKDERKQQEGDPLVKRAQRQAAFRAARGKMLKAVPTADVVVTNPTHFAVALKYEKGKDIAPIIVAKGQDLFALQIKEIARQHEVPMVENVPLARLLHRVGKVGHPIPSELYQVVADLLAHVYRTYRYYFYRLKARRAVAKS